MKNRPKEQFELYNNFKKEILNDKELMKLPYKEKSEKIQQIYYYFNKLLETDLVRYDLELNFNNVLGELIINDDICNPTSNNVYDAIITESGRNKIVKIRFCGEKTLKIQFKMLMPKALDKTVSLSEYQINKYIKEKCSIIFIIKNNADPNYYNQSVRNLMYFPNNNISSEGYQYYLLPYNHLLKGKKGQYNNFYYEIKHNSIMWNIGLRFKNGQLNIKDFEKEEDGENKTI